MRDESYKIELFVFPDGTSVEMIVFDPATAGAAPRRRPRPPLRPRTPHRPAGALPRAARRRRRTRTPTRTPCPVCGSRLVYPVDWERSGDAAWTLQLRCPECETRREVTLGRASVEHFNRELYHGAQAMAREADAPDAAQLRGRGRADRGRAGARPHPADGLLGAVSASAPRLPLFVSHTPATTTTAAAACARGQPLAEQDEGARDRHDRREVDEHAHPARPAGSGTRSSAAGRRRSSTRA